MSHNNGVAAAAATASTSTSNATTVTKKRRLKILCLHSFRTNAEIIRYQLARAGFDRLQWSDDDDNHDDDNDYDVGGKKEGRNGNAKTHTNSNANFNHNNNLMCEFICVNGPHEATGPAPKDVQKAFSNENKLFQWYDAERDETGRMEYRGIEESAKYVDAIVEKEKVDGLLGFSQGATLIGELLKRRRRKKQEDKEDEDEESSKSLRFAVLISGMPSRADVKLWQQDNINLNGTNMQGDQMLKHMPTLHVVGRADQAIPPALTNLLHKEFGEKAILAEHEKGHEIPILSINEDVGRKVKAFFKMQAGTSSDINQRCK